MILTAADIAVLKSKFLADRRLSDKESTTYDKYTPTNWFNRLPIIPQEQTPPKSGFGYTQSPYISQWTTMWGVNPLTDLPKYRMMYRTVPIIKKAIDKTVATAISKGFELDLPADADRREEILEYIKDWIAQQEDFKLTLQQLASDALVYGNAYAEIVYDEIDMTEERSGDPEFNRVEIPDPHEDYKIGEHGIPYLPTVNYQGDGSYLNVMAKGNPVWIKPLDPLWMRVRRDSYGNIYGYLQYLSTPPVAFTNEKVIHIRFNPKSWWTENAYGTSQLMSLIRTQEAIWTIENDLILISHACAKPPLIFSCGKNPDGSMEEPWTEGQFTQFVSVTNGRGPGGDIYHRGDVESKPLPFPASSLAPLLAHLDYHVEQRMICMGVPPDLLGVHASSNRSTAMVTMDDWVNTIQLLQQQIADAIQEQLFKAIVEKAFGEGTPVPEMVWNQVYEKDMDAEVQKVMALRSGNIITTNEARAWLSEVGKKLEPVTGGDSLLPPMAYMPTDEQKQEMPAEDSVFEEEIEPSKMKAEYSNVTVKKPLIYETKPEPEEASDGFAQPGAPSGTGQSQKPDKLLYPLLKKHVIAKAKEMYGPSTIGISNPKLRAEYGRVGENLPLEKDLTNVKIKLLESHGNVETWLVSGDKVAARYSKDWKHSGEDGIHDYIGGHHFVFDYIPENEIWVSDLDELPQKTALHEFVERKAMKDEGMTYADAHIKALKAEGTPDTDIQKRSYLQPKQVKETLGTIYPKIEEKECTWKLGDKVISFDEHAGIIYVHHNDKIVDQLLVRSSEDIEKFVRKYETGNDRKDIG